MELNLFVKELFSKAQEEGFSEYEVYYVDRESLSISVYKEEVEKYMAAEESRKSEATEYAHKQHSARRDTGFWQLRTPGKDGWGSVAISDYSGNFSASTGNHVGYSYLRPAMWIR